MTTPRRSSTALDRNLRGLARRIDHARTQLDAGTLALARVELHDIAITLRLLAAAIADEHTATIATWSSIPASAALRSVTEQRQEEENARIRDSSPALRLHTRQPGRTITHDGTLCEIVCEVVVDILGSCPSTTAVHLCESVAVAVQQAGYATTSRPDSSDWRIHGHALLAELSILLGATPGAPIDEALSDAALTVAARMAQRAVDLHRRSPAASPTPRPDPAGPR